MRADAARNRAQILDAARDLVAQDGADLTMDALAARAGVAVGTLYRHFPTKSDLVDAVVEESVARIAGLAEEASARVAAGASAWDELTAFWVAVADGPHAGASARLAAASLGVATDADLVPHPGGGRDRALGAIGALLDASKAAGETRDDVTVADLFMLMSHAPERDAGGARERYFEIVGAGLRPR